VETVQELEEMALHQVQQQAEQAVVTLVSAVTAEQVVVTLVSAVTAEQAVVTLD
jgi:hypothetical protein